MILSPNKTKLYKLLKEWKKKDTNLDTSTLVNDYNKPLIQHIQDDEFIEDTAFPNGSSIAFILTYKEINILFLGDSHPEVIINGLNYFGYCEQKPIEAALVKLSHHGSAGNTSIDLLKCITSQNYVISTNGNRHQHPHKQLLARLINEKKDCNIYFNYESRMNKIFSPKDMVDFPQFKAISITKEFKY
jgi:hypothetical protein